MTILLAFDNDGVLRDESVSYERCIVESVGYFDSGKPATEEEITKSREESNNDWERTYNILKARGIFTGEQKERILESDIIPKFQELYLGETIDGKFTGYINNEPWLADNVLLAQLKERHLLAIVSGAPQEEIRYTLKRNGAEGLFALILGMHDCNGKSDGLLKAMDHFGATETYFCDDRPSGIQAGVVLLGQRKVTTYGIMPPQVDNSWRQVLLNAGAEDVFANVREYSHFLLGRNL